jgi:hypothetical protein
MAVHLALVLGTTGLGVVVSKIARLHIDGLLAVLVLAVIMPASEGHAQQAPGSHTQRRFALAAETTFRKGVHAILPPHISTLLGISKEAECAVMQSVVHTGNLVQGFDVLVTNKNDIVIFVVDEIANEENLYLTSPAGTLRKVVSVKAGVGEVARATDKNRKAFEKEKQFWVDRLVPSGAER